MKKKFKLVTKYIFNSSLSLTAIPFLIFCAIGIIGLYLLCIFFNKSIEFFNEDFKNGNKNSTLF